MAWAQLNFLGKEGRFLRSAEREEEDNLATGSLDGSGVEGARAELTSEVGRREALEFRDEVEGGC